MSARFKNFVILLLIGFVVYANALNGPFMLDDFPFLVQFQQSTVLGHFVPIEHTYYRPLAYILPHINYLFFKNNPTGYHVSNLLLLIVAAWCLVLMLCAVMPEGLAMLAGILFLVHPLDGIMVNYITANVFAAQVICMCLSLYFLLRSGPRPDWWRPAVWFILALLCHETSFMLPFYAVLFCMMQGGGVGAALRRTKWLWAVLGGYMLFRTFYVPFSNSLFYSLAVTGLSWDQMLASVLSLLIWYAQKLFVPVHVFLMWSLPFVRHNAWDWVTAAVVFAVFTGFLLRRLWVIEPKIVLFILWFLIGLLPVFLGAFATPNMGALLEPHWFIPASIGLFAALVLCLAHFVRQPFWQKALAIVLTVLLMVCAWSNNRLWGNETNFYEQWLSEDPGCKAVHYFLGALYDRQRQYDKARQQFQQSILGRSKDWMVYLYLGEIDLKQGKIKDAGKDFQRAYDCDAHQTGVLNGLGVVDFQNRKWDDARQWFERSIQADGLNLEARMNLVAVYRRMGDVPKQIAECEEILKIAPDFAPARQLLEKLKWHTF